MIRRVVGWSISWVLYGLGDLVSKPMSRWDCMAWLYPAYNWLMLKSYAVQNWAGNDGPWKNSNG